MADGKAADQPKTGQGSSVSIPQDMKAFNRALIEEFRANRGTLSGPMAGRTVLLLTTTGARSGQPRTAVLGFGRHDERYVVIASNNGRVRIPPGIATCWRNQPPPSKSGQSDLRWRRRPQVPRRKSGSPALCPGSKLSRN